MGTTEHRPAGSAREKSGFSRAEKAQLRVKTTKSSVNRFGLLEHVEKKP